MFQKKKKFVESTTPEQRLADRWEQQVFFLTRKHPTAQSKIKAIMKKHESKKTKAFVPCEAALTDLADFSSELQGL